MKNRFFLLSLCTFLVTLLLIPVFSLPSNTAMAQQPSAAENIANEIARLLKEFNSIKQALDKLEAELENLLKLAKSCVLKSYDTSGIEAQIAALEGRISRLEADLAKVDIDKLKKEIKDLKAKLKQKEAELKQKKRDLKNKQNDLRRKQTELSRKQAQADKNKPKMSEWLQYLYEDVEEKIKMKAKQPPAVWPEWDKEIKEVEKKIAIEEKNCGIKGHRKLLAEISQLQADIAQLNADIAKLQQEIKDLEQEIKDLKALIPKLEKAVKDYNRIKNGIRGLKNELNKIKNKLDLLKKLLALKQEKSSREMQKDEEGVKKADEGINETKRAIDRLIGWRSPTPPQGFGFGLSYISSGVGMGMINGYIDVINGGGLMIEEVPKIHYVSGWGAKVFYQYTPLLAFGIGYENFGVSASGRSGFGVYKMEIAGDGILAIVSANLPQDVVPSLWISGNLEIGSYNSGYKETDVGSVIAKGNSTATGFNIGAKAEYPINNNVSFALGINYKSLTFERYTDSDGNTVKETIAPFDPIKTDFSGLGFDAGFQIRI